MRRSTVAASHKTLDYHQADEDYWQDITPRAAEASASGDVKYDDVTHSYYVGVGVLILEEGNHPGDRHPGRPRRPVEAVSVVSRSRIGQTGRTRSSGRRGRSSRLPMPTCEKARAIEAGAATEAINDPEGLRTGYVVTDLPGVRRTSSDLPMSV
ncbi:MAG: hypothetical protein IPM24_25235 [Bryobacterales bacterium]|nr:hypothetical protein [Bryobacterales bacterium]